MTSRLGFLPWVLLGLALGVLGVIGVYAPASWLAAYVAHSTHEQVWLQEPRGTIWRGSAVLALTDAGASVGAQEGAGSARLASRIYWDISPHGVGVQVRLGAPCCMQDQAPISAGVWLDPQQNWLGASWALSVPRLVLPAQVLSGLGAPWNTLQLGGELLLHTPNLAGRLTTQGVQEVVGQARVQAKNISTALSTINPLGDYVLSSRGTQLRLQTEADASAALQLSGSGQIEQGRVRFEGEALAAPGREAALSNLLHIIGQWQPTADGRARSWLKL